MQVYMFCAALLCEECGVKARTAHRHSMPVDFDQDDESSYDSDNFPKGPYPDGGGEADTPQHCDRCSVFLENPLTGDGYAYVREAVENGHDALASGGALRIVWRNPVVKQWSEFYGIKPGEAA
jgi:hypothetical protein